MDAPPDFFAVVNGQRACREFTDTPVGDEDLALVLEAATRAPSAENRQPWHFVVVRDRQRRHAIGEVIGEVWRKGGQAWSRERLAPDLFADVDQGLRGGLIDAPVLIVVCGDTDVTDAGVLASSIYPATQNLMLAAHALGLGSVLTTIATIDPAPVRELIAAPAAIVPMAIVPIGHPARALGRSRRQPIAN
ncbi:MAG: nitroreductase family protein, partial [Acidimicrobiales bacterium]